MICRIPILLFQFILIFFFSVKLYAQKSYYKNSKNLLIENSADFQAGFEFDSIGYIDKQSIKLDFENPYGLTFTKKNLKGGEVYNISLWRHNSNRNIELIITASWNNYYEVVYTISERTDHWDKLSWQLKVPDAEINSSFKVYAFNHFSNLGFVDELKIEKVSPPSVLPLYMLTPIFYEVANHYVISKQDTLRRKQLNFLKEKDFPPELFTGFTTDFKTFQNSLNYHLKKLGYNVFRDSLSQMRKDLSKPYKKSEPLSLMHINKQSAYLDKIHYSQEKQIILRSENMDEIDSMKLYSLRDRYDSLFIKSFEFFKGEKLQKLAIENLKNGFYFLKVFFGSNQFNIPFIKENGDFSNDVCIIAPISTWHAYNNFGGKSFYRNAIDLNNVHKITTKRPITSILLDSSKGGHDFYVLHNIYQWFKKNYSATVYPDFWLEKYPEKFKKFKTIVLAQHCEYFSTKMYSNLKSICKNKNLLSLGGNQIYWKIRWNSTYDTLECRKDRSFFENSLIPGMHWRDRWASEASFLGVGYTHRGIGTYNSYSIKDTSHFLLKGIEIEDNRFGRKGYDGRGISGDETDEILGDSPKNIQLIAQGNNKDKGGGDMVFFSRGKFATFSCGSIACGSGLNYDKTFSMIIKNFMRKYHGANSLE